MDQDKTNGKNKDQQGSPISWCKHILNPIFSLLPSGVPLFKTEQRSRKLRVRVLPHPEHEDMLE
jgi:hypothetical protein